MGRRNKMGRKLTYLEVEKIFRDGGCELLSENYKNSSTKLEYKCSCGNVSEILLYRFKKGCRCKKCGYKKVAQRCKHSYEYVNKYFRERSCILLSTKYVNAHTRLDYICSCGNRSKITFNSFQQGVRCDVCGLKKVLEVTRYSYDYVKKYFEDHGCVLNSKEYENKSSLLSYTCKCGEKSVIRFGCFKRGSRCRRCGVEKLTGENSVHWNFGLTEEEREIKRNYIEYREWRTKVYRKNDYTCQKCGKRGGNLNAHHIKNYSTNKDLRLVLENGITLCKKCHNKFHKKYGINDNSSDQMEEFKHTNIANDDKLIVSV